MAHDGRTPLGRAFTRFWIGSLASNLADGMAIIALPLVAALLTDDPLVASGLFAARFLPWVLFGLLAGVIADRVDRARLMVAANLVRAGALVVLAVVIAAGHGGIWVLYGVMFAVMTCEVCYDIAGRALLPDLALAGTIDRANGRLEGGRTVTQDFAGGPVAGLLFVVAAFLPVAATSAAYLLGALVLLGLPRSRPAAGPSPMADLRAGFVFVFLRSSLGPVLLFSVALNTAFMGLSAVLVLLARDHFGVAPSLYGVFVGSSAVGAVVGAASAGWLVARFGRFRLELVLFTVVGLCFLGFGLAPNAYVAGAAWVVLGAAITASNIVMLGAIQLIVPGAQMGRVMSMVAVSATAFGPVAALLAGLLGRVELYYVPLASGVLVLASLALSVPALRDVITEADRCEDGGRP